MPLKPNRTNNGVDLNEIDVSQLALVERKNLIDDLAAKLRLTIENTLEDSIKEATDTIKDAAAEGASKGAADEKNAGPAWRQRSAKAGSQAGRSDRTANQADEKRAQEEFEKIRKRGQQADRVYEKALLLQKKKDKEKRADELKGNIQTSKGKRYAETLDDMADDFESFDQKELEKLKDKIADLKTDVVANLSKGKEADLLTSQAVALERALELESKSRKSILGQVQGFMSKNSIDVTSIIAGVSSNSPLVGFATKFVLDTIREHKEDRRAQQRGKLNRNAKTLSDTIPQLPESVASSSRMDTATLDKMFGGVTDIDTRHAALQRLHGSGQIDDAQLALLTKNHIPPGFRPMEDRFAGGQSTAPVAAPSTAPSPVVKPNAVPTAQGTPVPQNNTPSMEGLTFEAGGKSYTWEEYQKVPKRERDENEKLEWLDLYKQSTERNAKRSLQDRIDNPPQPGSDLYDFMMDPDLVGEDIYYSRAKSRTPERVQNPQNVVSMPQPVERVQLAQAAMAQTENSISEAESTLMPERVAIDNDLYDATLRIEKLTEKQLIELQDINKSLTKQIAQADLAADAARRDQPNPASDIIGSATPTHAKKGGVLGSLFGGLMGAGGAGAGFGSRMMAGLKGVFGGGKTIASGAKGIGALGEAGEGVGFLSKLGKMFEGIPGISKLAGAGKLVGKLALPLTIILGVFDFVNGFMTAGDFLGKAEGKLTTLDRVSGGVGGVVKGLVGIIDFFLGLVGIKSDLGGFFGKATAKVVSGLLKIVKLNLMPMILGFRALGKVLDKVPWETIYQYSGLKIIVDAIEFMGNAAEKLSDWVDKMFGDESKPGGEAFAPLIGTFDVMKSFLGKLLDWAVVTTDAVYEGFTSFKTLFLGLVTSIGDKFATILGFKNLEDAFGLLRGKVSNVITGIGDFIERSIGVDNFKALTTTVTSIVETLLEPFNFILDLVSGKFGVVKTIASRIKSSLGMPQSQTTAPTRGTAPDASTPSKGIMDTLHDTLSKAHPRNALNAISTSLGSTAPQRTTSQPTVSTSSTPSSPSPVPAMGGGNASNVLPEGVGKSGIDTDTMAKVASQIEKETGYPARMLMTQFGVESGWGKSVSGDFNYFGITKAASKSKESKMAWTNEVITADQLKSFPKEERETATEMDGSPLNPTWSGKKRIRMKRAFASYKSLEEGVRDKVSLIMNGKRYKGAFEKYKKTGDVEGLMRDVAAAGYATDPKYAETLVRISKQNNIKTAIAKAEQMPNDNKAFVSSNIARPMPAPPTTTTRPPTMQQVPSPIGTQVARASAESQALKTIASSKPTTPVYAPSSNVTNNSQTTVVDLKAKNTESTYQRNMDAQYVRS